jgi:transposase
MNGVRKQHPSSAPQSPEALFQLALGLTPPWSVVAVRMEERPRRLLIELGFEPGAHFACPECGQADLAVRDTEQRQWRHMNFFQYQCYIEGRVPRVQCPHCGKTLQVPVPWARPGSGFTLLFEAMGVFLAREMPLRPAADILGIWDTRLARVVRHWVDKARAKADYSAVTRVGMDETSSRRGQNYVSNFVDLNTSKVLFSTPGRDHTTVERFAADLRAHGGDPDRIQEITLDMSEAYIKGAGLWLPNAELTFDKFHVLKLVGDAVDEVRRAESKTRPELKGTRYLWLRKEPDLPVDQRDHLDQLRRAHLKTARAHALRGVLADLWQEAPSAADEHLTWWYNWAIRSRLEPIKRAARTIKAHWEGVLNSVRNRSTNAVLEGVNSLAQAAKARARGYRNIETFITMIYHIGAGLNYGLPNWLPA